MNRRSFLQTGGAAAGVVAGGASLIPLVARPARAGGGSSSGGGELPGITPKNRKQITSTIDPWVPNTGDWNVTTINHLYRRAGFGASMAEVVAATTMTPSAVVDALLDDTLTQGTNLPQPPNYADQWLQVAPYLGNVLTEIQKQQTTYAYAMMSIRTWWTSLMVQPKTMLRERMVLFWANHFVVEEQKVYYPQSMYSYLDYFRKHPWGNFKQMVKDVTISPAMLIYLDGWYSYGSRPNENYARELMELFTLGVTYKDGTPNYTETDIQQIAKALTGWNIHTDAPAPNVLPSYYDVNRHDSTFKSPFGAPKKDYGLAASGVVTDDVIDLLFQYKGDRLAYFICSKLYQFFVYHDATTPEAKTVIQALADTFQSGNWELKPVLKQLLKSQHFFDSANIGAEIKSPYEYLLGMTRSLDIPINPLQAGTLYYYAAPGAQILLDPPNVKGWPGYHSWISTTTLPARNATFAGPLIHSSIPANGAADGYGNYYQAISLSDAQLTTWASQFPSYSGKFEDFLSEVATFLSGLVPSQTALTGLVADLPSNYYEWPTLVDSDKLPSLRVILYHLMLLANYQLT